MLVVVILLIRGAACFVFRSITFLLLVVLIIMILLIIAHRCHSFFSIIMLRFCMKYSDYTGYQEEWMPNFLLRKIALISPPKMMMIPEI